MRAILILLTLLGTASNTSSLLGQSATTDLLASSVRQFLAADRTNDRAKIASEIVKRGYKFGAVLSFLRRGRSYKGDVQTGRLLRERVGVGGVRHPYAILIPADYTPDRQWPVRFDLHGGMGASEWKKLDGAWSPDWRKARDQIVIVPAGWWDSMWWEWSQVENFETILREVRKTWNIDENRVVMYGGSDGGAALFFHAMRQPDRWAGYAGHVAPPDRLVRAEFRPDGQMHVSNLADQRFHLGYGEKDPKVPLRHLKKYMELFKESGALLDWYVLPGQGHSLRLPPERNKELAEFLWGTTRDPLPDALSWSTERTDRYARRQWVVIEELSQQSNSSTVDKTNILPRWGTRIQLKGPTAARKVWGRVTLKRTGNRVTATTTRVARFTLLLSPEEFDLSRPVTVEVNGVVVFDEMVSTSLKTLLKWAAIDDDRTRLFAAEVSIEPR